MRKVLALGLLLISSAHIVLAQQHAPTVAQCQADAALWGNDHVKAEYISAETAHLKAGTPNPTDIAKLPLDEIVARQNEMGNCFSVDEKNYKRYSEAQAFYTSVFADRVINFVTRHGLWDQLKAEDSKGIR